MAMAGGRRRAIGELEKYIMAADRVKASAEFQHDAAATEAIRAKYGEEMKNILALADQLEHPEKTT